MSLVHDLLQDLDARWHLSDDELKVLPHSHSVRIGDSLAVPAANSVPSGLSSEPSDEEDLGRKSWANTTIYLLLSGLFIFVLVLAWRFLASEKPAVEPMMTALSSPSEQVLVAEVLQSREKSGLLAGAITSSRDANVNVSVMLDGRPENRFSTAKPTSEAEINAVTPLFKSNKVVELQERAPAALPVLNETVVSDTDVPSGVKSAAHTQLPVLVETIKDSASENALATLSDVPHSIITGAANNQASGQDLNVNSLGAVVANELSIEDLLSRASRAFELQRYREPEGNNAYELYQAVLAKDNNNVAAKTGILDIKQAYLSLIRRVIVTNYYYKVPELAKNARSVGVSEAEIDSVLASVPEAKAKPVRDALAQARAYEQDKRQRKEATKLTSGKDSVSVSEQTNDQKKAQETSLLIKAGQLSAAEEILKVYVGSHPRSQASLQLLFSIYIQQQQLSKAESLIAQAQHLPGDQFSYLVAQLLIQRGDMAGAMRSLTSQDPELSHKPAYYALMAALYHKLGEDQLSQVLYQRLIAHNKTNPSYWLGLAMARDGLRAPSALQAYRQVQHLTPKPVTYSAYVAERIDALSRLQDQ